MLPEPHCGLLTTPLVHPSTRSLPHFTQSELTELSFFYFILYSCTCGTGGWLSQPSMKTSVHAIWIPNAKPPGKDDLLARRAQKQHKVQFKPCPLTLLILGFLPPDCSAHCLDPVSSSDAQWVCRMHFNPFLAGLTPAYSQTNNSSQMKRYYLTLNIY